LRELARGWFDQHLRGLAADVPAFEYAQVTGLSTADGQATSQNYVSAAYPGLTDGSAQRDTMALAGPPQVIVNPPGGSPAAVSSLPGLGQIGSLVTGFAVDLPGQVATFAGAVLDSPVQVVGAPSVTLRVASPTGTAILFVKLYDVDADGQPGLPQGLVAPVRLTGLTADLATASPVTVTLPAVAHRFETGHRLALAVTTTDQAYQASTEATTYQVALGAGSIDLPTVDGALQDAPSTPWIPFLATLLAAALLLGIVLGWRGRRRRPDVDESLRDVPLVAANLTKAYADGFVAVRALSFRVEPGQVVGLLGPNGAGKTTTLRMLMGLILPSEGDIRVFGHRVRPGAAVLSRLGAFVEGTGFLPHLSGTDNLALYWKATGRPAADAHLTEALQIAGLGTSVERTVRTYSQGMRQRLAIAQAMLGLPDLLVLDEPTNGLDPPQIREMREVLRRYADGTGRTVLVSSHLLAEVEQTCTHVVVMNRGRLIAQGTVGEVVGASTALLLDVDDRDTAMTVLAGMEGVAAVQEIADGVVVELAGATGSGLVRSLVGAGVGVERLTPRRRLEDVFLSLVGEDSHDVGQ
nr:ATP-binding cassette domain-containing protein [Geodermatophilaceae bacterium]